MRAHFWVTFFGPRFLDAFLMEDGPSMASKIDPWGAITAQKGPKGEVHRTGFATLGRPGRDLVPKTVQERIFMDLGLNFGSFGLHLCAFRLHFKRFWLPKRLSINLFLNDKW